MDTFTVAFFGHKRIEEPEMLEKCLDENILRLLSKKDHVQFLVGRDGDFDQLATESVYRIRMKYHVSNCDMIMIIPDLTPKYINKIDSPEHFYDAVELAIAASLVRQKYMIQTRNQEMIERADLILCYLTHESPVAWKTVQHAILQGKMVINIAEAMAPEEDKETILLAAKLSRQMLEGQEVKLQ